MWQVLQVQYSPLISHTCRSCVTFGAVHSVFLCLVFTSLLIYLCLRPRKHFAPVLAFTGVMEDT